MPGDSSRLSIVYLGSNLLTHLGPLNLDVTARLKVTYVDEVDIMRRSMDHGPKEQLVCYLSVKLSSADDTI